jgi:hypothetical protein
MEFRKSVAPREFGFDYHATAWPMFDVLKKIRKDLSWNDKEASNSAMGKLSQLLCLPTYKYLEMYLNGLEDVGMNFVPSKINKSVKFAGASLDFKKSSAPESVQEDFRLLIGMYLFIHFQLRTCDGAVLSSDSVSYHMLTMRSL